MFKKKITKDQVYDIAKEILEEYKEELKNLTYVPGHQPPQGTPITPKNVRELLQEILVMIKLTSHPDAWFYGNDETNNYGIFQPDSDMCVTVDNDKKIKNCTIVLNFYIRERGTKGVIQLIHPINYAIADTIYIYTMEEAREVLSNWVKNTVNT